LSVFTVEMLPAEEGDAIWVEYGSNSKRRRLLVDGGVLTTSGGLIERVGDLGGRRRFELMVVTHVDNDHIDGVVKLLASRTEFEVGDVWFNAWSQISQDRLGPKQGEMLTELIERRGFPHNAAVEGGPIGVPGDVGESLVRHELPGGMEITVLGPRGEDLVRLRKEWEKVIERAGLEPGGEFTGAKLLDKAPRYAEDRLGDKPPNVERWAKRRFVEDTSPANPSSISLLLEYRGRSLLLTGDARSDSLCEGIDRLNTERGTDRLHVDVVKLPHHGSKNNVSNELIDRLDCHNYLFSTSGRRFHHPDDDAVARVLFNSDDPVLHFNYLSEHNRAWGRSEWMDELGYETVYPAEGSSGLVVDLNAS
jgi:beta-lactamase superfamily II metal-dependent hydrolase